MSQCSHHSKEAPLWHLASVLPWILRLDVSWMTSTPAQMTQASQGFELLISNSFYHSPSSSCPSVCILSMFSSPVSSALKFYIQTLLSWHSLWQVSFIFVPLGSPDSRFLFSLLPTFCICFPSHLDFMFHHFCLSLTVSTLLPHVLLSHLLSKIPSRAEFKPSVFHTWVMLIKKSPHA